MWERGIKFQREKILGNRELMNEVPKLRKIYYVREFYARTHRRDETGKYTVTMPL